MDAGRDGADKIKEHDVSGDSASVVALIDALRARHLVEELGRKYRPATAGKDVSV